MKAVINPIPEQGFNTPALTSHDKFYGVQRDNSYSPGYRRLFITTDGGSSSERKFQFRAVAGFTTGNTFTGTYGSHESLRAAIEAAISNGLKVYEFDVLQDLMNWLLIDFEKIKTKTRRTFPGIKIEKAADGKAFYVFRGDNHYLTINETWELVVPNSRPASEFYFKTKNEILEILNRQMPKK